VLLFVCVVGFSGVEKMKYKWLKKCLSVSCLLTVGLAASQALYAQPQYNQGYGDFPPASIDQQLQGSPNTGSQPAARQPPELSWVKSLE